MLDESIWNQIGGIKNRCTHKKKTRTEIFCNNVYNVSGVCNEKSCPIANTKYATVREENEMMFLYIKEPERMATPEKMYEKIELGTDYDVALKTIEEELEYWDPYLIHKCKQRYTKLFKYLVRKEEILEKGKVLKPRQTKKLKKDRKAGKETLEKTNIRLNLKEELLKRLEEGAYSKKITDKIEEREMKNPLKVKKRKFVAEFEESHEKETDNKKKDKKKSKKPEKQKEISW